MFSFFKLPAIEQQKSTKFETIHPEGEVQHCDAVSCIIELLKTSQLRDFAKLLTRRQ